MNHPENIRFVAEDTLGKLAKWLRILGYDTIYEGDIKRNKAHDPKRIRLTRRQSVVSDKHGELRIFIESDHYWEQLTQVIRHLNIAKDDLKPFSRCIRCNDAIQHIDKAFVHGKVPDYIWETHHTFWTCPQCDKIFWPGSHQRQSMDRIQRLFEE